MKVRRALGWLSALALFLVCPGTSVSSEYLSGETQVKEYRLWYRNYDSPPIHALVALAFDKTPEYGSYRITRTPEMAQGRVVRELERQQSELVDLANVATSSQRKKACRPSPYLSMVGFWGFGCAWCLRIHCPGLWVSGVLAIFRNPVSASARARTGRIRRFCRPTESAW